MLKDRKTLAINLGVFLSLILVSAILMTLLIPNMVMVAQTAEVMPEESGLVIQPLLGAPSEIPTEQVPSETGVQ